MSLLQTCTNKKHKAIMVLLYGCGLRIGEVINLKPGNIDSTRMVINIIAGKGKKDRQVQLPENILQLLRDYNEEYQPKGGYLFQGQSEPQYSERSIKPILKELC